MISLAVEEKERFRREEAEQKRSKVMMKHEEKREKLMVRQVESEMRKRDHRGE